MKNFLQKFKEEFINSFNNIGEKPILYVGETCAVISWIFIFVVIGLTICAIYGLTKPHITKIYKHAYVLTKIDENDVYTKREERYIAYLLEKQKIIPISAVYKDTLDYYDSLITVLVAMLGIFAFVSWFSLRSKISGEMPKVIQEQIDSNWFSGFLENKIAGFITQEKIIELIAETIEVNNLTTSEEQIRQFITQEYELKSDKIKDDVLKSLEPLNVSPSKIQKRGK